jgi:hypothetical protein
MKKALITIGAALLLPIAAQAQSGHNPDYRKCKKCKAALSKAIGYVKANYKRIRTQSLLPNYFFTGFMAMMDDSGQLGGELAECVRQMKRALENPPRVMGGWTLGMASFFLAEYAIKTGDASAINTIRSALKRIERDQEESGGWGHFKDDPNKEKYAKNGGSRDLGIITSMIYGTFLFLESKGTKIGGVKDRALKNLEKISDGAGFSYGIDMKWGDLCMSRASYLLLMLLATENTSHPMCSKIIQGLDKRYKNCAQGHAFAPLHYFSVAAAMHRLGPGHYKKFTDHYLDKMIAAQNADGSIDWKSDGGKRPDIDKHGMNPACSTAVFATIIMLQQPGVFSGKSKRASAKRRGPSGGRSPFGSSRTTTSRAEKAYASGAKALEKKRYKTAIKKLNEAIELGEKGSEIVQKARDALEEVIKAGRRLIEEAERNRAKMKTMLQKIARDFKGTPVATEAHRKLDGL